MPTRTPVNLADLAQSFAVLRPEDPATRRWIAAMLGFAAVTPSAAAERTPMPELPRPPRPAAGPTRPVEPSPFDLLAPEPVKPETRKEQTRTHPTLSFDLVGPTQGTPPGSVEAKPEWWEKITVLDKQVDPARVPPPDPLLLPIWSRTTYMRALSTAVLEGRLDISRLVDLIARLEVPAEIPRLPWPTMRNGLQVLVDYGDAMMPFREDQRRLLREVQELAGSSAFFEVFLYRGTPARWSRPLITRRDATAFELPPPGTPILALTDLGIGALAAGQPYVPPEEWRAVARSAEAAGCRLTAFVPYAPDRWPPLLRGELAIVHWHHARGASGARATAFRDGSGDVQSLLDDLRQRNPQAVALAHVASLASRVELSLLRELRLTLLPAADGGAEADLWFSPLASVRSEKALLLRPEVAEVLRRSLYRADPSLFEEAWRIVKAYRGRTGAFEGTRLEEEINYWLAQGGGLVEATVEELLRRAVKTVFERGTKDDEGLALWSVELLDSLPKAARDSEAGRDLGVAAGLRLHPSYLPQGVLPDDIGSRQWLVPVDVANLPKASLWVGREPEGLVLGDREELVSGGKRLDEVPATTPFVLWLSWDGSKRREKVSITPGQRVGPIDTGDHEVTIQTFTGISWKLTPSTAQTPVEETPHAETVLDLSGKELAALPGEVLTYPNLKELDLSRNRLEILPSEIGRLTTLQKLILDKNQLTELPPEIGALSNLEELRLAGNRLESLPAEVGKLQKLRLLDLRDNHLDTLPATLGQLTALEALDLRGNPLPMPASVLEQIDKPQAILEAAAEKKPARLSRADLLRAASKRGAVQPTIEEDLAERIRQGRCVPILGGWTEFEFELGVSEEQLTTAYGKFVEYPFPAPYRLEQLIEYWQTIKQRDRLGAILDFLGFLKNVIYETTRQAGTDIDALAEAEAQVDQVNVTRFANLLGYPRFASEKEDPLLLLANLPLPVYVTTSYFQFLEDALRRAGKDSRTESYRPEEEASLPSELASDPSYEPSASKPLVYHLFGVDRDPSTLVLSEDDYLRYLMEVSRNPDLIPPLVRRSLAESSLLFLGHDPDDLRWRILGHAIRPSRQAPFRSLSVFQVGWVSEEKRKLIEESLGRSDLTLFWGPPADLLTQVYSSMRSV